jgi:preprotein translocase subunit SecE
VGNFSTKAKLKMSSEAPDRTEQSSRERPAWVETLLGYPKRAEKFLQEVRAEMKLVVWPSWAEVRSTTLVVIMTTIIFAVFLWMADKISQQAVSEVIKVFRPKT